MCKHKVSVETLEATKQPTLKYYTFERCKKCGMYVGERISRPFWKEKARFIKNRL